MKAIRRTAWFFSLALTMAYIRKLGLVGISSEKCNLLTEQLSQSFEEI